MEGKDPRAPAGWAADKITEFLEAAQQNSFATFANLSPFFGHLVEVDSLFRRGIEHLGTSKDWLVGVFLLRTHSAFLGAVRLGVSGQLPEAYMVLRSCLESALYSFHIEKDPSRAETWIRREESAENKKKTRSEFTAKRVLDSLKSADLQTFNAVSELYERTIDFGAHPNESAFISNMVLSDTGAALQLELRYLSGHNTAFELCLKSILQVALASLSVFQLAASEKFAAVGISDRLLDLKRGF